jgi:ATP-dependent DNA helicase RecG
VADLLSSPILYLKGVGPQRAELLKKELGIFTFRGLLEHYPYRHIDRTEVSLIRDINPQTEYIQIIGRIISMHNLGEKNAKRLAATIQDSTGTLELIWFQGLNWVSKMLQPGKTYFVFGRIGFYQGKPQITHPEIEAIVDDSTQRRSFLEPVYPSTEKLSLKGMGGRQLGKLSLSLLNMLSEKDIAEILPPYLINEQKLMNRFQAFKSIHFPASLIEYSHALERLKFDELFIAQIRMGLIKSRRHRSSTGVVFGRVGELFNLFYSSHLPFELTGAQKRVLKELRKDMGSGSQMNRLLQGDVGSGKTIVALLSMLLAVDNGFQACLMAPTEILARQHFEAINQLLKEMPVRMDILTGSTKAKLKRSIEERAAEGNLDILIGTHSLIEDSVQFRNLGLAVIDEQHRFGVAQRAKLWGKSKIPPHVLVMTATPIPRTLAMTAYGDLDTSIMDELPPGRQPIITVHRYENKRAQVMGFLRSEIEKGRQVYIIFPLIEESETLDYENLMKGYENLKAWFPEPKFWISMVHGRQPNETKKTNMERFVKQDTQIMVSTTVIEVGVNIPNATVMVIESAEKFGLSQLHQLRGRVGRGTEKSYCILLTGSQLNKEARERLNIMCQTNDGFRIAEKDLEIRGPGDIAGTRQSGLLDFKLADIVKDKQLLDLSGQMAWKLLQEDPDLDSPSHSNLKSLLDQLSGKTVWSRIS